MRVEQDLRSECNLDRVESVSEKTWKIMIVDDDYMTHIATKMALKNFLFANRKLEFVDAYSGLEAEALLTMMPDVALVLMDVVLESYDSGLRVVKFIREELKNPLARIVLRTGQIPAENVIKDYDINDCIRKTEFAESRLYIAVMTALCSYRQLLRIDHGRMEPKQIVEFSNNLRTVELGE